MKKNIVFTILFFCAMNIIAQEKIVYKPQTGIFDIRKNIMSTGLPLELDQNKMEKLDTVQLRIQYSVKYRSAKEDPLKESVEALYIGSQITEYRENILQYGGEHMPEALKGDPTKWNEEIMKKAMVFEGKMNRYKPTPFTVQKDYPEKGIQRCYNYLMFEGFKSNKPKVNPNIYYDEPIPHIDWELEEGDTVICDYACQRASALFRGRTWKVWYAPGLPYQDGPWKLQGLPGLILKAEDVSGDFHFEAVEIKRPEVEYIVKHPAYEQYVKGTPKRLKELTDMLYKNPRTLLLMMADEENIKKFEDQGVTINIPQQSRTPCLIEKYE